MNIDKEVKLDSPFAKKFGFTSQKGFDGYLWRVENDEEKYITLSTIESKKGGLLTLMANILNLGFDVHVPTPSSKMRAILERRGFVQTFVYDELFEDSCEIFVKKHDKTTILCEIKRRKK